MGFDQVVVVSADQHAVGQGRLATGDPRHDVVGVAVGGWSVAAGEDAAAVAEFKRGADGGGDQPMRPASTKCRDSLVNPAESN